MFRAIEQRSKRVEFIFYRQGKACLKAKPRIYKDGDYLQFSNNGTFTQSQNLPSFFDKNAELAADFSKMPTYKGSKEFQNQYKLEM